MPGRFRFRLEAVRKVRQQAQDAQQRVVADVLRGIAALEDQLRWRTRQLRAEVDTSRNVQCEKELDVARLRGHQYHQTWLQRQILEAQAQLVGCRARLAQEREKLTEASRRLKVIEKLRERQWERYLTDQRRAEQRDNDEVAGQRHVRQAALARRGLQPARIS